MVQCNLDMPKNYSIVSSVLTCLCITERILLLYINQLTMNIATSPSIGKTHPAAFLAHVNLSFATKIPKGC